MLTAVEGSAKKPASSSLSLLVYSYLMKVSMLPTLHEEEGLVFHWVLSPSENLKSAGGCGGSSGTQLSGG